MKPCLILANMNIITFKNVFPLLKDNTLKLGYSIHSGDREFLVPDDYPLYASGYRVDDNGKKYIRVKGIRWFTSLDCNNNIPFLELTKTYNEKDYPKYDNYDAINVDKTKDIPKDYFEPMGVPISFLDKYNTDQFEIIGLDMYLENHNQRFKLNNKIMYARIVIKRKYST